MLRRSQQYITKLILPDKQHTTQTLNHLASIINIHQQIYTLLRQLGTQIF